MWTIVVKGEAEAKKKHYDLIVGEADCQDVFSEYFGFDEKSFSKVVTEGYMNFVIEGGELMTLTTYSSTRKLTPKELEKLKSYTQGQWSDGIGEGYEQRPCAYNGKKEVYVSPWKPGQNITITQTKDPEEVA